MYERKNLFEYRALCPKEIFTKVQGSFYCYRVNDVPAKNEKFYLELVHELVKMESIKLGKVIVLNILDKGLFLFAYETCGITYELLQWPCVCLTRNLTIKNSHVHYSRQVYVFENEMPESAPLKNQSPNKESHKNVFQMNTGFRMEDKLNEYHE